MYKYIEFFSGDYPIGYISTKDIYWFTIIQDKDHFNEIVWIVKAGEQHEDLSNNIRDGFEVSPYLYSEESAKNYLDNLVRNINKQ